MTMPFHSLTSYQEVYQKLLLNLKGITFEELISILSLDKEVLDSILKNLDRKEMITYGDGKIVPIKWWEKDHIEMFFNIPRVDQNTFCSYANDLCELENNLNDNGLKVFRPYTSETTFEIIITAIVGLTIYEFAKGFFNKLGQSSADFLQDILQKYKKNGINEIIIEGRSSFNKSSSEYDFTFKIKARSKDELLDLISNINRTMKDSETPDVNLVERNRYEIKLIRKS